MINLSEKQIEYIDNANKTWNWKVGAVRSGKSFVDISAVIPKRLIERQDKSGLKVIIGVSKSTIERNVLEPMREIYGDKRISTINNSNIAILFGCEVYCIGAEKKSQVKKIQGSSIAYCYGDEVAKWSESVFTMLQSRLDKEYSCFDGTLNPESPYHWLKKVLDKEEEDKYIQEYIIDDNPYLSQKFVKNLKLKYEGTVYYDRFILGKWALAEGLIYQNYNHVVVDLPSEIKIQNIKNFKIKDFCVSIDYGTLNAFAALLWYYYNGIWYAIDGYYYSGRAEGIQKTDNQYLKDMIDFVAPIYAKSKEYDLDKIEVIIDPSAASFITELKKSRKFKVRKADNAVSDGIRDTAVAIRMNLINVSKHIKEWEDEIKGYRWNEPTDDDDRKSSAKEEPLKENDHYMDSTRYFVKTKKLAEKYTKDLYQEEKHNKYSSIF